MTCLQRHVTVFILSAYLLLLAVTGSAQERTGIVLRKLMAAVEEKVEEMESEMVRFAGERQQLVRDWQTTRSSLAKTHDPLSRESLRADLLLIGAKLNQGDLQQVSVYLQTIADIVPKLKQLKHELRRGMSPGAHHAAREQVGQFMTTAAGLLHALNQSASDSAKAEVAVVETTLVGLLRQWETPGADTALNSAQLDLSVRALHDAYAQFITVRRLLEQERTAFKAHNYQALARLTLVRLGQGNLNTDRIATAASTMRSGIRQRLDTLRNLPPDMTLSVRTQSRFPVVLPPTDQEALSRMRRGQYDWQRR